MTPFRIRSTQDGDPVDVGTSRVTGKEYRCDGGRVAPIVVTLGPADVITFRPKGSKREVRLTVEDAYQRAVRADALATIGGGK